MKEFIQFIVLNACYVWNKLNKISIKPTHIIIHSTATPGVMARAWFSRWNKSATMEQPPRRIGGIHPWDGKMAESGWGQKFTTSLTVELQSQSG